MKMLVLNVVSQGFWGGIHPPADDIPGRVIGEQVFRKVEKYFSGKVEVILGLTDNQDDNSTIMYPTLLRPDEYINLKIPNNAEKQSLSVIDIFGRKYLQKVQYAQDENNRLSAPSLPGVYFLIVESASGRI